MPDNRTYAGRAVSTTMATGAILKLIKSPIVGDMSKDSVARTIERLDPEGDIYPGLSGGEKKLVRLALEIWRATDPLGGIDKDNRRRVMIIQWYFYLGEAEWKNAADLTSMDPLVFKRIFGEAE